MVSMCAHSSVVATLAHTRSIPQTCRSCSSNTTTDSFRTTSTTSGSRTRPRQRSTFPSASSRSPSRTMCTSVTRASRAAPRWRKVGFVWGVFQFADHSFRHINSDQGRVPIQDRHRCRLFSKGMFTAYYTSPNEILLYAAETAQNSKQHEARGERARV